jgi:hypothetical protein
MAEGFSKAMSGKGRHFFFHGAFRTKEDAVKMEQTIPGSFVHRVKIKGSARYLVLSERKRP